MIHKAVAGSFSTSARKMSQLEILFSAATHRRQYICFSVNFLQTLQLSVCIWLMHLFIHMTLKNISKYVQKNRASTIWLLYSFWACVCCVILVLKDIQKSQKLFKWQQTSRLHHSYILASSSSALHHCQKCMNDDDDAVHTHTHTTSIRKKEDLARMFLSGSRRTWWWWSVSKYS